MRSRWIPLLLLLVPALGVPARGESEVRLLTDEALPRYLQRGAELARAGEWDKMVDIYQRIVTGDPQVFPDLDKELLHAAVHTDDGVLYRSARELCLRELAAMPPEGLRAYRSRFDTEARRLLEEAREAEGIEARLRALDPVIDHYLVSSYGDDALEEAADLQIAAGRLYEALERLRLLVEVYPSDGDRDLALALTKAAWCAARIGAGSTRDRMLDRLVAEHPNARPLVEGRPVPVGQLRDHPQFAVRGGATAMRARDWPMPGGDPTRSRAGEDLPEDLPRKPYWTHSLAERDGRLQPWGEAWAARWADRPELGLEVRQVSRLPAPRAVAIDGVVFYKDYARALARRAGSGTLVLLDHEPLAAYHEKEASRPGLVGDTPAKVAVETLYRYLDCGGNTVIGDGRAVYVNVNHVPPRHLAARGDGQGVLAPVNALSAFDVDPARLAWNWDLYLGSGGMGWSGEDARALEADFYRNSRVYFRGPGVVAEGLLYTVVDDRERDGAVSLWCMEADSGRVRFRTRLHERDTATGELPGDALVAVAGGVAYVVTNAGVVAAVDALPPGRVRWIRRYERSWTADAASVIQRTFRLCEPVVTGGKVLVAPSDGTALLALDAQTGELAWSLPAGRVGAGAYLVGTARGVAVLANDEDRLHGIEIATGKPLWGQLAGPKVALTRWASGRGWVGETTVHIPTRHVGAGARAAGSALVERFDVLTGEARPPLEFDVPQLGNLLCVEGRLVSIDAETIRCFTTRAHEEALIDARLEREGTRADLLLERALVALHDPAGADRAAARADFERALGAARADPDPALRLHLGDLVRLEAIENLLAIGRANSDTIALDEARVLAEGLPGEQLYSAQIAMRRVAALAAAARPAEALAAIEQWTVEHAGRSVRIDGKNGPYAVPVPVAARALFRELFDAHPDFAANFETELRARIVDAAQRGDVDELAAIPARYAMLHPTHEALFALARLQEEGGAPVDAEQSLREVLADYPQRGILAEAHLRLARLHLARGLPAEAAADYGRALDEIDDPARDRLRALLEEVARGLAVPSELPAPPAIGIPLAATPGPVDGAAPVPVSGALPTALQGFLLMADERAFTGVGPDGAVLWTVPLAGGQAVVASGEPASAPVAALVARHRLAVATGGDLLIADLRGMLRVELATGEVRWRVPGPARGDEALRAAQDVVAALARDLDGLMRDPGAPRRTPLPLFALSGELLIRVQAGTGTEVYDARTGARLGGVPAPGDALPVGPPQSSGQLVAVGWSEPGTVQVLKASPPELLRSWSAPPGGVVLAPPVIDPFGRLLVVSGSDAHAGSATLRAFDAAAGDDASPLWEVEAITNRAMVLSADGRQVFFHDGGSGGANLHRLDARTGDGEALPAPELLREVETLTLDGRLFVFSWTPGDRGVGARLWRFDPGSGAVLAYEGLPPARAWSRPTATRRYLALAGSDDRLAFARLFEREASERSSGPQAVFRGAQGIEDALTVPAAGTMRYAVPPALVAMPGGLAFGHPFGTSLLRASTAR